MAVYGLKTGPLLVNETPEQQTIQNYPTQRGAGFGAALEDTIVGNPLTRVLDIADRYTRAAFGGAPTLTPEQANERYAVGDRKFDAPINEDLARSIYQADKSRMTREDVIRRSGIGLAGRLTAGLLGTALDPINLAAGVFPEALIARFAALPEGAAGLAGAARTGARSLEALNEGGIAGKALYGGVTNFAGQIPISGLSYGLSQLGNQDYTAADAFLDVTFGTVLGAGLHAGIGAFAKRLKTGEPMPAIEQAMQDAGPQVRMDALRGAVSDVMEGRPVNVDPVVKRAVADFTIQQKQSADIEWAKGTLVAEPDGSPKRVFHGTGQTFQEFDESMLGKTTGANSAKRGFFFTDNPAVAASYADAEVEGGLETPILNFLLKGANPNWTKADIDAATRGLPDDIGINIRPSYLSLKNPKVVDFAGASTTEVEGTFAKMIDDAKAAGHDGVILQNARDPGIVNTENADAPSTVYIAFSPDQIRSTFTAPETGSMQSAMADITRAKAEPFYDAEDLAISESVDAIAAAAPLPKARAPEQGIGAVTRDTQDLDEIVADLDEQIAGARSAGLLTKADEDAISGDAEAHEKAQATGQARNYAATCLTGMIA